MSASAVEVSPRFYDFGLSAYSFNIATEEDRPTPSGPQHTQMELEMVLVHSGSYVLRLADRYERIGAGEIGVYWAGLPHRGYGKAVGACFDIAQIPIVHVLSWARSASVVNSLLDGRVLRTRAVAADESMFPRWSADLALGYPQLREIVELEMQARLRRFFQSLDHTGTAYTYPTGRATAVGVATAVRYVVHNFTERIGVDDIAAAVGWHRAHLMESFHQVCGLTVWEYVTRVRLAEAQRLLRTTDLPAVIVRERAGFVSTSRMYDAFRRHYDVTPSAYRETAREERLPCPDPDRLVAEPEGPDLLARG